MQDHTFADGTQEDTTNSEAVAETQKDTLLAGKYKSKADLLDATAQIYNQVEGKMLTPSEVIELTNRGEDELEMMYKGLERQYHTSRPQAKQEDTEDDLEQAMSLIEQRLQAKGYVRREELEKKEYEETELNSYFSQRPDAKSREQLIRTLANTEDFKNKSYVEVDNFITSQLQSDAPRTAPSVRMGQNTPQPEKTIGEMSDDEFLEAISGNGSTILR